MKFADYFQREYGKQIDEIFTSLRDDYQQCVSDCKKDYWDCLRGCPNPPDPTHCTEGCRDGLNECLRGCSSGKEQGLRNAIEKLKALEIQAIEKFKSAKA